MWHPCLEAIPGYQLTHHLGTGGFSEVWAAKTPDGAPVALKFLDCRHKSSSLVAQEIRLLRRLRELQHPYIIRLHSVCAASHYVVLVMERADGSLRDLHRIYQSEAGRDILPEDLLDLLEQAARALDFLAGARLEGVTTAAGGLQHCDIKPSNLLLLGDTLKVTDFGLCLPLGKPGGGFRGTPPYAAPELYEGRATKGTDQYALAVTYAELCTGNRAFRTVSDSEPPDARMPLDLSRLREREALVLARAIKRNATERWPSCQEFVAALRRAQQVSRRVVLLEAWQRARDRRASARGAPTG